MTFVGKILVIVIMLFAVLFLGISTVVFSTHTNWKDEVAKVRTKADQLRKENDRLGNEIKAAQDTLAKTKADQQAEIGRATNQIQKLESDRQRVTAEMEAARKDLEVAQENARTALVQAKQDRDETDKLRVQKSAVEKQANEFKLQHADLTDKIRELQRQNQTLDNNNRDLRDRVAKFSSALRANGLPDDISRYRGLESPPAVEGEVARVDARNQTIEITIGSDDGLVVGHELFLYREKPRPEYLGKVQVIAVDPDRAVAKVIGGRTVNGKKIKEGDIVASTITKRS
jgi:chromosome segregation ATPase